MYSKPNNIDEMVECHQTLSSIINLIIISKLNS